MSLVSLIGQAWRRFTFLLRRRQMDQDLAEEMRQHAALKTQKNISVGMGPQEAELSARRQLGNLTRQREESRQSWGFPLLESIAQDIQYGLRGLRKTPGFTTMAMLTLALGIGSCTAIFSIVYAVMLRPLPYKDSSRMVHVWAVTPLFPQFQMGQSAPDMNNIKTLAHSFESTTAYAARRKILTSNGEPEQLSVPEVTSDFFDFFGMHPVLGREFLPEDEQKKNGDVVMLGYELWQRRFSGDPAIVGRAIMLDQKPYTVAGVAPAGFAYPEKSDAWAPLVIDAKAQTARMSWAYSMLAKLRPGVPLKSVQSELDGIAASIAQQHPKEASGIKFPLATLQESAVGKGKAELLALMVAVGFLLLIACANVSNLVLSRGLKRQREIAVRAALGASRGRILRQLLLESLLLAIAGGLAGIVLAAQGVGAFRALAPAGFPRLDELRVEPATALIACLITALAGILCGLAPALSTSRANLNLALKEKTATAPARRFSLRGFLVITEVALALVLLTGSALMVQSMARLLKVDTGLRVNNVHSALLNLPRGRYASEDASRLFARRLLDSLHAQPQFSSVALSASTVMQGNTSLLVLEREALAALGMKEETLTLESRSVSPGFFETMGVRLVRGRFFNDRDVKGAPQVIIINDSVARRFFPGQDPIGRTIKLGTEAADQFQVVGQVPDTMDVSLQGQSQLQIYSPLLQDSSISQNFLNILVRSSAEPSVAVASLRSAVAAVDKDQPLTKVQSMTHAISESVAQPRFRTWLLSAFAFTGLALTVIGIYGVISYSVGQRTQEMGIRMALGAPQASVLRLILRQGVVLALTGVACGLIGSFLLMRLLASQLYQIKPSDPLTLAGAAGLMVIVALAGSYIPARRATKVDPMIALRYE